MRKRGEQLHFVLPDVYERLVPQKHFLRRVAGALDFSYIDGMCERKYRCAEGGPGRPPEPPQRMFKLLLLMYLYQVKFERELERRVNDSVTWRWFCGYQMDEPVASHKTLWLFRHRLGPELFDEIFARLVDQCIERGLVGRKRWHVDATKQDGAATTFSQFEQAVILTQAMIKRLESMQGKQEGDVDAPPTEMDSEMKRLVAEVASEAAKLKRVRPERVLARAEGRQYDPGEEVQAQEENPTQGEQAHELPKLASEIWKEHPHAKGDCDARIGTTSKGKFFCGYISTAVVDEKHGVVLSSHTVPGNVDQGKTFHPAYEQATGRAGKPEGLACDRAFDLVEIRQGLAEDGVQAYIPMIRTHRAGNVLGSELFNVTEGPGGYKVLCPCGLGMRQEKARANGLLVFRGTGCKGCPLANRCTTAKDGIRHFEFRPELRKLQEEHWALRKTVQYTLAMKRRMATIEPVFGHGKTFHNLGKSIYRSLPMQRIQTIMSLFAVDLEKLVRYAPQPA